MIDRQTLRLDEILEQPVDWRYKAFPATGIAIGNIKGQGWALDSLSTPVLVIRRSAILHNISIMNGFCRRHGAVLMPHAKTPMSPQLAAWQLDAGAWGLSVANLHQARVFRHFGARRIFIANQVLDPAALRWLAMELHQDPNFEVFCLVDSSEGVEVMEAAMASFQTGRPLDVLIEIGPPHGRAGCRNDEEIDDVVRAIRQSKHLRCIGLETYEGAVRGESFESRLIAIGAYLEWFHLTAERLERNGAFDNTNEVVLSAGGSLFFDKVVDALKGGLRMRASRIVLRSGSYLMQDAGMYQQHSPLADRGRVQNGLRQALELWTTVLSRPETDLAVLDFGKRDVSHDHGPPVAVGRRLDVMVMNDQHTTVSVMENVPLQVGDRIAFAVKHACTALDKWRLVPLIDDSDRVVGGILTFF